MIKLNTIKVIIHYYRKLLFFFRPCTRLCLKQTALHFTALFDNRITREMEEEFTHALYQLSSPDHVAKKIVTEILTDDTDGSEEVSSLSFSQELGSRLQQIGDVTKALEVLLYCLELDRGIVSHSEFDPNAEFEANDPRGRLFASSKGRSIIAESLKQVVQSR